MLDVASKCAYLCVHVCVPRLCEPCSYAALCFLWLLWLPCRLQQTPCKSCHVSHSSPYMAGIRLPPLPEATSSAFSSPVKCSWSCALLACCVRGVSCGKPRGPASQSHLTHSTHMLLQHVCLSFVRMVEPASALDHASLSKAPCV